jgi:hypothetical protein
MLAPAFPSQAETTLTRYSQGGRGYSTDSTQSTAGSSQRGPPHRWNCFGCSGPHPYSEFKNGNHVVICPNRDVSGVREHAAKNIKRMQKNHKKKHIQNQKRKNLATANFTNFDEAGQHCIREQCFAAWKGNDVSNSASTMSSITGSGFSPLVQAADTEAVVVAPGSSWSMSLSSLPAPLSSLRCRSRFKATCLTLQSSLVKIWTTQTALRFVEWWTCVLHLRRAAFTSLQPS